MNKVITATCEFNVHALFQACRNIVVTGLSDNDKLLLREYSVAFDDDFPFVSKFFNLLADECGRPEMRRLFEKKLIDVIRSEKQGETDAAI